MSAHLAKVRAAIDAWVAQPGGPLVARVIGRVAHGASFAMVEHLAVGSAPLPRLPDTMFSATSDVLDPFEDGVSIAFGRPDDLAAFALSLLYDRIAELAANEPVTVGTDTWAPHRPAPGVSAPNPVSDKQVIRIGRSLLWRELAQREGPVPLGEALKRCEAFSTASIGSGKIGTPDGRPASLAEPGADGALLGAIARAAAFGVPAIATVRSTKIVGIALKLLTDRYHSAIQARDGERGAGVARANAAVQAAEAEAVAARADLRRVNAAIAVGLAKAAALTAPALRYDLALAGYRSAVKAAAGEAAELRRRHNRHRALREAPPGPRDLDVTPPEAA